MLVLVLMVKITCLIVAIFAFATTCSVSVYVGFTVRCARDNSTTDYRLGVSYPFRLEKESFVVTLCNGSHQTLAFVEGASGSSQFYVFVGITAFLYSLIALFIYVCFDAFYRKNNSVIAIDFIFTCMFAVFWLIASSAWAQGVSDVKYFTDPTTGVFPSAAVCRVPGNKCSTGVPGDFTTLNVSIVFGFLNTLVWGGHVWFLYKETPWFKIRAIPTDPGVPNPAEAQLV